MVSHISRRTVGYLPMYGEIRPRPGQVVRPDLLLRRELAHDAVVPLRLEVLDEAKRVHLRALFNAVDEGGWGNK